MQQLTPQGLQKLNELAQRYTVSPDAVMTLLHALVNGNGMMAQFEHGDLGDFPKRISPLRLEKLGG